MRPRRISNEWLMGAAVGAYLVLSFVLTFWESAFIHSYCANTSYGFLGTRRASLGNLVMLCPEPSWEFSTGCSCGSCSRTGNW